MLLGFKNGRFLDGWLLIFFIVLFLVCMWKLVILFKGVGVVVSFRVGVRIGI